MVENKSHARNYPGTKQMHAENQDMEFVNDTLEEAEDKKAIRNENNQCRED